MKNIEKKKQFWNQRDLCKVKDFFKENMESKDLDFMNLI